MDGNGCISDFDHLVPDAPHVADLGDDRCVPFEARRVRTATVVHLNATWFLQNGVDVRSPKTRKPVEQWLLSTFGVSVPTPHEPAEQYAGETVTLWADRYGALSGAFQGGSGRCGLNGRFNAKGIGRTPLVSAEGDWYHSHGCMWLEEAMREAIASELIRVETNLAVQPIIAVIDLGVPIRWDDGSPGERRAVVVRVNVRRLAYLQRSVYFGTSGYAESDQAREQRAVAHAFQQCYAPSTARTLLTSLGNVSEAAAVCFFHRLWMGPFYSSNNGIDGELLDFGSFRSLPDWRPALGDPLAPAFGQEMDAIRGTFMALAPLFKRHGLPEPHPERIQRAADSRFQRTLDREAARAWGFAPDVPVEAVQAGVRVLHEAREKAQRVRPLHATELADRPFTVDEKTIDAVLEQAYLGHPDAGVHRARSRASLNRILAHRPLLEREALVRRCSRFMHSRRYTAAQPAQQAALIQAFIRNTVARSRRRFRDLPSRYTVGQQLPLSHSGIDAYVVHDPGAASPTLWIELIACGSEIWLDALSPLDSIPFENLSSSSGSACYAVPAEQLRALPPYLHDLLIAHQDRWQGPSEQRRGRR